MNQAYQAELISKVESVIYGTDDPKLGVLAEAVKAILESLDITKR